MVGAKRVGGRSKSLAWSLPVSILQKSPSSPNVVPGPLPQPDCVILTCFPPRPGSVFPWGPVANTHEADQDYAEPSSTDPPPGGWSPKFREEGCWDKKAEMALAVGGIGGCVME